MSIIDKIKLDGTTYDVGKTPDTTLAVSGSPADAAKVGTELDKKVDKITGKGLSTEDYTTAEKTKLAGLTQIEVDDTLSIEGRAADAKKTGDKITSLKEDLNELFYSVSPNENGEFIWTLRFGYWELSGETLVWKPATNRHYLTNAYPIKVKSGDIIHIKSSTDAKFFAQFSADGSTWAILTNTIDHDFSISSDGYVMISVRKKSITFAFTDEDVTLFFEKYLTIYRKKQTDNITKQIDNINDVKGIVVNEASYVQSYVTDSSSTTQGSVTIPIEFPAAKGETFIIKANFSVTHPEYFSDIKLSVRERYNNATINDRRYADLSESIEYTVAQTNTTSIIFTVSWYKESDSSVSTGYYENFDYSIAVTKKNDDFSDVMTEAGEAWEV